MTTKKKAKKRVTVFLNSSIDKQARAQAIVEELTLSKLMEKALISYLPPKTVILKPQINVIEKITKETIMTQFIKETVTTQENTVPENNNQRVVDQQDEQPQNQATQSQTIEYVVYFFFGLLNVLLAFRLIFKLMGASMSSAFVRVIYAITGIFIMPFEGIFSRGYAQSLETTSVIEPATLVAFVVYAILAWGVAKLVHLLSGEQQVN